MDQDGDGLSDVWEMLHGFNTVDDGTMNPDEAPGADPDRDGATNFAEAIAGTSPLDPSNYTSGQGTPSGVLSIDLDSAPGTGEPELVWWGIFGKEYRVQAAAGLSGWGDEGPAGTGAGGELSFAPLTPPGNRYWRVAVSDLFSDADALSDWEERELGTSPTDADSDGDAMLDDYEVANDLDPLAADGVLDTDGDGVQNGAEALAGTAAGDPDTDQDGSWDAYENLAGTDPLSHESQSPSPGPTGLVVFTPGREAEW